nr:MAG TPA: hypothetical protein [Bacteriophage sp.]
MTMTKYSLKRVKDCCQKRKSQYSRTSLWVWLVPYWFLLGQPKCH